MAKKKKITVGGNVAGSGGGQSRTIVLTAPMRGNADIATYLSAVRIAENVDWPKRVKLYDLYADLLTDGHLSAVVNKRKSAILCQRIECRHKGKVDDAIQEQVDSPWFFDFLGDLWDTILYDQTLIQMYRDGKWLNYDLVPRKHVDAQKRLVYRHQSDLAGFSWDEYDDLLFVGREHGLGLLAKIVPYAIYKRNCLADWAQYAEKYGQPMTEGEYDGWDEEARRKMAKDLFDLGASGIFLHPTGTKITLHESTQKSGSSELFKGLVNFCNEELSKIVLGNTLTTQASETGTQALGTVQKRGEESINAMDKQFILNVLNYDFIDLLAGFGFDTREREFVFVQPSNTDLSARIQIDVQLKNTIGLPMSDDYFYEKYGIERPADYDKLKAQPQPAPAEPLAGDPPGEGNTRQGKRERGLLNALSDFFGRAPADAGALEW